MADCLFCQIAKGEIPANIVYQDEQIVAFKDLHPIAPVHILVVPKKHIEKLQDMSDNEDELLGKLILAAKKIAVQEKIDRGFKIIINCGREGGQKIFHLHVHLLGGWEGGVD
jgi:histidine triad (HIT) family protein